MSINSDESINNLIDIENCDDISETYKPKAFEPELNASSTSTLREALHFELLLGKQEKNMNNNLSTGIVKLVIVNSQMQTQSLTNVNNYEYMPQEAQMSGADGYLQSQPNNYYIESSADVNPGAPCSTPCSCNCPSRDYNDYDLGARQMQEDSAAAVQSDDYGMQETTAIHQCQVAQRMPREECCTSSCQQMPYYSYFPSNCVHGEHFIQNLRSTQPDCFPNYQTAPSSPPGMGMNMNYGPSCGPSYPPSCDPYSAGYYSNYSPSYGPPKNTIYGADDKLQAQTVYSTDFNPFSRPGNNLNHFPSYQASGSWGSFNDSNNCGTYPADFGSFNSGGIYMPPMCYNVQPCSSGGSCMLPPAGCVYGTPCPANYMSLPTTYCCPPSPATCHGAAPFPAPNTASYEMPSGCNQL
ncbi:GH11049 [Drosophila grimshawi]|uniref:GH11049 n=1 Tax=Drosophila grimshawi TaxID=7222 RepID=B4JC73_DROGR|nr:GH11049 [Drosophila grimshawi]